MAGSTREVFEKSSGGRRPESGMGGTNGDFEGDSSMPVPGFSRFLVVAGGVGIPCSVDT